MIVDSLLIEAMQHYGLIALLSAFGVGVLTSLAPCSIITLPLLVGSAVSLSSHLGAKQKQRFILYFSFLFVSGLVISFSILMLAVAKMGALLSVAPFWAYTLAAAACLLIAAYSAGWLGSVNTAQITSKLLRFRLLGAVVIGMIFGLVSTPCASAPLAAIITIAEKSSWSYSYLLVLLFALGHALLLLLAGVSVSFAQRVADSVWSKRISLAVKWVFSLFLALAGAYFIYEAYTVF